MAVLTNQQFIALGVTGVLVLWYIKKKATQATATVIEAVNPLDQNNLANRAAESAFTAVTGNEQSPGVAAYDWLNGDRDEWTMGRTDEIIWQRRDRGEPLEPMTAIAQARYEWNRDHAGFFNKWSRSDLMGYQP